MWSVQSIHGESKHIGDLLLEAPRTYSSYRLSDSCLCIIYSLGLSLCSSLDYIKTINGRGQQTFTSLRKERGETGIGLGFMERTLVAQGKYLLCNILSDKPREFWDSKTGSHFIFTNRRGRRWVADVQKTLESWKDQWGFCFQRYSCGLFYFSPLKGWKQHGNMSSSLSLMAPPNSGSLLHTGLNRKTAFIFYGILLFWKFIAPDHICSWCEMEGSH